MEISRIAELIGLAASVSPECNPLYISEEDIADLEKAFEIKLKPGGREIIERLRRKANAEIS